MDNQRERISLNGLIAISLAISGIAAIVIAALSVNALWMLIAGVAALGGIMILLTWVIASKIAVPLLNAKTKSNAARYEFLLGMASKGVLPNDDTYIWRAAQIAAPEQKKPDVTIDPRHSLLTNLCLLTIKNAAYGPTSHRLMTADDAQADRSGLFADRMNWNDASKYGQDIGYLYTQVGGKQDEQGLKVKCDEGNTAADLLVALHNRSAIRDSAVNALPGVTR